jgi:peptidyl-tRNA hydrolase, PTH1 family
VNGSTLLSPGVQPPFPEQPYLVVGLGNPGREYRFNRHNVGFMAIDTVSHAWRVELNRVQAKALVCPTNFGGRRVILAKPQTFMNLSGQSVSALLHFYKVPLDNLLVVHDDLDLPVGTLRIRPGGGSAGQKGLGSTIEKLGTEAFPRLRIGIGRPPGRMDSAAYVLEDFPKSEQETVLQVLDRARQAVEMFISEGIVTAMNTFNGVLARD